MRARRVIAAAFALLVTSVAIVSGCGSNAALVGGECATGYTECNLKCVDISNDPNNCGGCGISCMGSACTNGTCPNGGNLDGSIRDGATNDGASSDGSSNDGTLQDGTSGSDGNVGDGASNDGESALDGGTNDGALRSDGASNDGASSSDGSPVDGAFTDSSAIDGNAVDACVPPFDTATSCGSCTNSCSSANPFCLASGSTYVCGPCAVPQMVCNSVCVDLTSDSNNCGSCGNSCPSNICSGSHCVGTTSGDVVYIGHDYNTTATGSAQARVLSNAVFIPISNPLRILSFEHYADATSVGKVKAIIANVATELGRSVTTTVSTNDSDVPTKLDVTSFDVLLVYDQATAPTGTLATLGTSWASTLATFTQSGGVVIELDGAAGSPAEMPLFAQKSGTIDVLTHTPIANGTHLNVVAPSDDIGVGVLSPYGAGTRSVDLTFAQPDAGNQITVVVQEPVSGNATVLHRLVPPN